MTCNLNPSGPLDHKQQKCHLKLTFIFNLFKNCRNTGKFKPCFFYDGVLTIYDLFYRYIVVTMETYLKL